MKTFNFNYLRFWKVNFFDWLWFVFYLNCNEFNHKLNLGIWYIKHRNIKGLVKARDRAHKIENALS